MRHTREVVAIYAGTLHNGWTEWEGESEIVGGTKKNSNRMECCFALDCDERHRLQLQLLFSDRIQIHRHQQSLLCTGCTDRELCELGGFHFVDHHLRWDKVLNADADDDEVFIKWKSGRLTQYTTHSLVDEKWKRTKGTQLTDNNFNSHTSEG